MIAHVHSLNWDGPGKIGGSSGDEADFTLLARKTLSHYVDNGHLLAAGKPEPRECECVYVQRDTEIGLFGDDLAANCAP